MNFLNLGLGELLGLIGVVSAGVTALYLLDRSKKRHVVATLRFWTPAGSRTDLKHRRHIQQPWSLLLQILSLILLLTAIAGPQFGVFDGPGRAHVLLLDTSAWMGALTDQGTLLDQAKADARAYIAALPKRDLVMIVRADAVATPASAFESDRDAVSNAIQDSQAGASALNLSGAFDFAERALSLQNNAAGEVVYVGAARVTAEQRNLSRTPTNLRVIRVEPPSQNIGLRRVSLRRSQTTAETWDIFVSAHNYDMRPRVVDLELRFAEAPVGSRRLSIDPGRDAQAAFSYRQKAGGWIEARLNTRDSFPQDDRVTVEVPALTRKVAVFSNDVSLRTLFASNPALETEFHAASAYDGSAAADVVVLDGIVPPTLPDKNIIWIAPPKEGSVIPVKAAVSNAALRNWSQDTPLGTGLYTQDVTLPSASVFEPASGDITVASVDAGPVIVARNGPRKQVAIGFRPTQGAMKFELATPLLIANILRWMLPGSARTEIEAGTVGAVTVPVGEVANPSDVHVMDEAGEDLPFRLDGPSLQFFSGTPGNVRVQLPDRELQYALSVPDLTDTAWQAPASAATGIPDRTVSQAAITEIWPWLAIAGALGLLADWILFGRNKALQFGPVAKMSAAWRKAS